MRRYKVVIQDDWSRIDCKRVWFVEYQPNGRQYVAKRIEIEMKEVEEGFVYPEPTMTIPNELAQAICDSLLGLGFTPDREAKTQGKLEATEYHLQDLRKLLKLVTQ